MTSDNQAPPTREPEDAVERAQFNRTASNLFGGDKLVAISAALSTWSRTSPPQGSLSKVCAIYANEIADAAQRLAKFTPPTLEEVREIEERHEHVVVHYGDEPWNVDCVGDGQQAHEDRGTLLRLFRAQPQAQPQAGLRLTSHPVAAPSVGVMKIVTNIALAQHARAEEMAVNRLDISISPAHAEAQANVATLIDLWNRFVCRIPGLNEHSIRIPAPPPSDAGVRE